MLLSKTTFYYKKTRCYYQKQNFIIKNHNQNSIFMTKKYKIQQLFIPFKSKQPLSMQFTLDSKQWQNS